MKLNRNDGKHLMVKVPVDQPMVTPIVSNGLYYVERKSNTIPYDIILQLNSVMAVIYTEQGNQSRRLGDLQTAKRYYQMAIRAHESNQQVFINVHNLQ
jgi:hypothetical protein